MTNFNKIPVVVFALDERTTELSVHCLKELGFENIVVDDSDQTFSQKLSTFFKMCELEEFKDVDLFIRTDSDRLIFEGIIDLLKFSIDFLEKSEDGLLLSEGYGYERFMKRLRGATPHIYSRNFMKYVVENENSLIREIQKPESFIGKHAKNELGCYRFHDTLTNLHEFGQNPSKMFNAFLNRISRGHLPYYDLGEILSDPLYGPPMRLAIEKSKVKKNTMAYKKDEFPKELLILDNQLGEIQDLKKEYARFKEIYEKIISLAEKNK